MDHLAYDIEDFLCDASFQRYCLGNEDADVVYWKKWIAAHPEKKQKLEKAKKLYFELNGNVTDQDFSADYAAFKAAFSRKQAGYMDAKHSGEPTEVKLWPKLIVAASIVFAISAGLWFYQTSIYKGRATTIALSTNDIKPGKNIATMTLGNGQVINLSDAKGGVVIDAAKLSYSDGSSLEHSTEHSIDNLEKITVATPRGGQYQVELPDGTNIWLNAASTLKFPSSFIGLSSRSVELTGEAYFEVKRNEAQPFRVICNHIAGRSQVAEVLGTHFNINSYSDEGFTKTTLLEGKLKVVQGDINPITKSDVKNGLILNPGEQSLLDKHNLNKVELTNAEDAIAWKDGYFQFNHTDLKTIMRQIERWYDVQIRYEGAVPDLEFGGAIQKNLTLKQVLKILNKSEVHFRMEGKEVIVMP